MRRRAPLHLPAYVLCAVLVIDSPAAGSGQARPLPDPGLVRAVSVEGVTVFDEAEIVARLDLEVDKPVPDSPKALGRRLDLLYHRHGYAYARTAASFDEASGLLSFRIDEGRFSLIEFVGAGRDLGKRLADGTGIGSDRVFNRREIDLTISRLLSRTDDRFELDERQAAKGAPSRGAARGRIGAYRLEDHNGKRVLVVHVRRKPVAVDFTTGSSGREDAYSPVDGLNPGAGVDWTLFAPDGSHHTFVSGFVSYKLEPQRPGYAFGFERSLVSGTRLRVGAGVHDLTASDDRWRASPLERSIAAFAFKRTFQDYYRRRGYQLHASARLHRDHELLASWRDERHEPLANRTDYAVFRADHPFRANGTAARIDHRALLLAYAWDTRGFDRDTPGDTYARHRLDGLHGTTGGQDPGVRVEWISEFSAPGMLAGDLDFRRHVLNARAYARPSRRERLKARLMIGLSEGHLPPQRLFSVGGIGSVRGHDFGEARGARMALVNVEYKLLLRELRGRGGLSGVVFVDAGRVGGPVDDSNPDWLTGVGFGLELWNTLRFDFGYRLNEVPRSLQFAVRLQPTF